MANWGENKREEEGGGEEEPEEGARGEGRGVGFQDGEGLVAGDCCDDQGLRQAQDGGGKGGGDGGGLTGKAGWGSVIFKMCRSIKWLVVVAFAGVVAAAVVSWRGLHTGAAGPAAATTYSAAQLAALQAAVDAETGASTALAGEDWAAWEKARPGLGQALTGLEAAFGGEGFAGAVKQAQAAWPVLAKAGDFPHARSAFVMVSDEVAQVVWKAKAGDAALGKVVVYYCPMTSEPANGRWVQNGPPLRNPFWGKNMLDCGAEYKP